MKSVTEQIAADIVESLFFGELCFNRNEFMGEVALDKDGINFTVNRLELRCPND